MEQILFFCGNHWQISKIFKFSSIKAHGGISPSHYLWILSWQVNLFGQWNVTDSDHVSFLGRNWDLTHNMHEIFLFPWFYGSTSHTRSSKSIGPQVTTTCRPPSTQIETDKQKIKISVSSHWGLGLVCYSNLIWPIKKNKTSINMTEKIYCLYNMTSDQWDYNPNPNLFYRGPLSFLDML